MREHTRKRERESGEGEREGGEGERERQTDRQKEREIESEAKRACVDIKNSLDGLRSNAFSDLLPPRLLSISPDYGNREFYNAPGPPRICAPDLRPGMRELVIQGLRVERKSKV